MADVGDRAAIFVDDRRIEGVEAEMTAAEILALAGLDADDAELWADGSRGQRIPPEQSVPVQEGSRFVTRPRR